MPHEQKERHDMPRRPWVLHGRSVVLERRRAGEARELGQVVRPVGQAVLVVDVHSGEQFGGQLAAHTARQRGVGRLDAEGGREESIEGRAGRGL
eukprot:scaffold48959_cov230-Isochrysis_galbana.AAC.1